ncbi:MAG: hypothetical protein P1P76_05145 [Anaerolineales bacterium]|nr:hypothetical protein [Anaerolineales bacterium]
MKQTPVRCFWLYSFVLIALTTIPYAIGFAAEGSDSVFTGFVFGVEDGNSYIAKMLLGATGDWLFRTPYSTQPQPGVLAYLPYLLIGKLAAGPELHLQLVVLYHLFRVAMIPLAIWATYRFVNHFLDDPDSSAWATVIATIGSGLGWLPVLLNRGTLLGSLPLGFISPETFGFLAYLGLPHLVLARALLLTGLRWYLESDADPGKGWHSGLAIAVTGLVQPLAMISAYAVIGFHQLIVLLRSGRDSLRRWRERWLPGILRTLGISLPVFVYYALAFSSDPFLRAWTEQNRILSPHPLHYLLAYGLLLPWVVVGVANAWALKKAHWLLPLGWVIIVPLLAYAPYNLQRRLPEGSWVALALLASYGISKWAIDQKIKTAVRWGVLVFSLMTPLLLVYGGIQVARSGSMPAFREQEQVMAFEWLLENGEKDAVVLTTYASGNALPAWAPVHVVIGHGPESANLDLLRPQVERFFEGKMSEEEQSAFLAQQRVDYILSGPDGSGSGQSGQHLLEGMQLVYKSNHYAIYRYTGEE